MENQSSFESFELQLNNEAVGALKESAKWSLFLAILGFVGIGFMVIAGIFMSTMMAAIPSGAMGNSPFGAMKGVIGGVYIVMALLYFFPIYYLFKYASGMKTALQSNDSNLLSNALVYLKSHHKFLGVSAIVVISLYFIMIIGIIAFGASSAM